MVVVCDGAVEVALGFPGHAADGVGVGIFRIEPDRLVEVRDGAVEAALVFVLDAAAKVDCRKLLAPKFARRNGAGARRDGNVA